MSTEPGPRIPVNVVALIITAWIGVATTCLAALRWLT
jgi:hypothetical protein